MNMLKKSLFSLLFVTAGLHAAAGSLQQNLQVAAEEKTVAVQMIEAMQGSVNFYQQAQKPLDAAGIKEQQSAWQSAVGLYHRYINDLRGQSKVARPALVNLENLPNIDALMLQSNQSKALFTRLLDEYIAHLGNVYEKKSNLLRFYRNVYVIASADDQNLSITPNEYLALVQTLENAAQQSDWGTTVNLSLPVIQADGSIVEKNLTLNEIKAAIKEIPLPTSYYATALKVAAGLAAGAAIIGGAYYAYNNPQAFNFLQNKSAEVETKLDGAVIVTPVNQTEPTKPNTIANPAPITSVPPRASEQSDVNPPLINEISQQPSLSSKMAKDAWDGMFGSKVMTPQYWQAGGDAELYGAPGLSGQEASNAGLSYLGGSFVKSGANAIATRVGGGELAGQGAANGFDNFAKYGVSPAGIAPAASKGIAPGTTPTISTLAQTRIGAQFEHLPTGYVQSTTTAVKETTKNISPTWEVNFGQ